MGKLRRGAGRVPAGAGPGHSTCPRLAAPSPGTGRGVPAPAMAHAPSPPPQVMVSDGGRSPGKPGRAVAQGLSPGPALPGAPVGGGEVGVGTRCWLVAAAALPAPRGPVDDDEAQAHDHEEHPKEGEAGSLQGQGSGSGTARVTRSPAHPRDPHPCPRPCAPLMLTKILGVERSGSLSLGMMRM